MAIATLEGKRVINYKCENCGHHNTFFDLVNVTRGTSMFVDYEKKLYKDAIEKDYEIHKCENCGYVQSWLWEKSKESNKYPMIFSIIVGIILFFFYIIL